VKASLELEAGKPGGGETHEGIGLGTRLTPGYWVADSDADESPEGEVGRSGEGGQLPLAELEQRREGNGR
jgi:hypothetical protein